MKRFDLLASIAPLLEDCLVVSNLGVPSQELHEIADTDRKFYMLGSMGLASSIALGLSLTVDAPVVAIEGDGAVLMNLGSLATIANRAPANLTVLVVDNGSYDSTGSQPTWTSGRTSLAACARGAGCEVVIECDGPDTPGHLESALRSDRPTILVSHVRPGNAKVAPIPLSPVWIRDRFRRAVAAAGQRP